MDTFECISKRRSVRSFLKKPVPKELVNRVLEAALMAPSAGDIHPYRIVVVTDEDKIRRIAEAALNQTFISQAPIVIVYLVSLEEASAYGKRGIELYSILDVGASMENLMLAATSLGLSTCWIGAFDERRVEEILNAPKGYRAVSLTPLGYSDSAPRGRPPPPISMKILYEEFQ
ncbi:MAG: nitroreductase family protein [Thermoproteota archaeon]|nr:nitroreductase family protein [Candidatus Brockarchaeota archaeon]